MRPAETTGLIPFGWRQQRARIQAKRVSSASVLRVAGAMGTWSRLSRLPRCRLWKMVEGWGDGGGGGGNKRSPPSGEQAEAIDLELAGTITLAET